MKNLKIILSGGGTGGHIYPAIAIAEEIKKRFANADILFVGAKNRMEMQKVPKAGYNIKGLWISGLHRKLSLSNLLFPVKLFTSMIQSIRILKKYQPNVVIGTGGFASAPILKVANLMNYPTVLQEQNSYAGITNKWVAKKTKAICVAYPHMERFFPKDKIHLTGNPVRQDLINLNMSKEKAIEKFQLHPSNTIILVIGGSLGSLKINQTIEKNMSFMSNLGCNILWQCGSYYYDTYKNNSNKNVKVLDFIEDMTAAYTAADIIISRSGAGSVSELSLVGKPVIFIPSPNVAENHQYKNATAITEKEAAICIEEKKLEKKFKHTLKSLINDKKQQQILSQNIKKLAKPNATIDIVNIIENCINP